MSKLTTLMRRAPKRTAAVFAAFAVAILAPLAVHAWGPDRPTYTYQNPAPHVTFNSMTGTPNYGDERNFVRIKEATAANNTYVDNINLQAGKQYTVMVYYHNNASSTLNDAAHQYKGVAQNAKMRVQMPSTVLAGEKARITGFVSADNAQPGTVWDEAYASASSNVALRYVPNSATIYSNGAVDGQKMPESLYTTGANLGYNELDGKLKGCNEFAGWVTYNIVVDQPNFEVSKEVAKKGTSDWKESINAVPGEEVDYRIHYKNTGTTDQNNVVIKDVLPTGVTYVAGTTQVSNAASNFQWKPTTNNEVTKGGLNIGNYAANGGAYVKFTAKLPAKDTLACGTNTLINKGIAETNNGNKSDNANVVVKKECEPPVVKYTCDSLVAKKLTDTSVQFTTNYTVANATFKSITYIVRNASGTEIYRTTTPSKTLTYTQTTPGKYSVEALVTVTVNGQDKTTPVGNCKTNFEIVKKVVAKYTCNALDVKSISRTEFRFSTAYTVENATFKSITYTIRNAAGTVVDTINATTNSSTYTQTQAGAYSVQATVTFLVNGVEKTAGGPACKDEFTVPNLPKEITVCELATKKYPVTIKESEFDSSKHSKNPEDCKVAPETIKVCVISTKETAVINKADYDETKHTTDFSKCEDTPVTPPELPTTGAGENIVAIVGLGAMIASIAYYAASRRALNQ